MENSIRKTYAGLDIGKFICAFLILFYHYFSEHGSLPWVLDEALSLYAVAVALFMSISGFLLFEKINNIDDQKDRWNVVMKQVKRILSIYLIWSVPYVLFSVMRWPWKELDFSFVFWQVQEWIFRSTFSTIWFMPTLAIGMVLTFWLVEKLPNWCVGMIAVILYSIGSLTLTYSHFGNMIPKFSEFIQFSELWLGGSRGWLYYAIPFLLLGRQVSRKKNKLNFIANFFFACDCVLIMLAEALLLRQFSGGHTGIDMTIMMVPTVYFVLTGLVQLNIRSGAYCSWMRKMSTLIFMSQRLFLTVLPAVFPLFFETYIFANYYLGAILICFMLVGLSIAIIELGKKYYFFRMLC